MSIYNPLDRFVDLCNHNLLEDEVGTEYLKRRGASESQMSVYKLGSLSGACSFDPSMDGRHSDECLSSAAVCNTCRLNSWIQRHQKSKESSGISSSSVIFPLTSPSGAFHGVQARSTEKKVFDTYMLDRRTEPTFFGIGPSMLNVFNAGSLILTEGPMDMLVVERLTSIPTVALTTNSLSRNQAKLVSRVVRRLILVLDSDEAGRSGSKNIVSQYGSAIECIDVKLDKLDRNCKDPNEVWSKHGDAKFSKFLKQSIARLI